MAPGSNTTTAPPRLNTPVQQLTSVDDRRAAGLARLGITTIGDLIRHLPTRYEQQWAEGAIDDLPTEAVGSTRGMIVATRVVPGRGYRGRRGPKARFEATLEDHSGQLTAKWFNAVYLHNKLHPGMTLRVQGKITAYRDQPQMVNPQWEVLDPSGQTPPRLDRLRPVYRATESLPSEVIEQVMHEALPLAIPLLADPLPDDFVKAHAMPPLAKAYTMAHRPDDEQDYQAARRRLAFNELLLLQLGIAVKRHYNRTRLTAPALRWSKAIDKHIRERFPFELTDAQNQVITEITQDLQRPFPMNRLLQGDVGAGKTVVALHALLLAVANRKQGALMAPTELLAEQHYLTISSMLEGSNVRIAMLSGGQSSSGSPQRASLLKKIQQGQYDIVIGTQALLAQSVTFGNLAIVVIDEQHRFGVLQRAAFRQTSVSPPSGQKKTSPAGAGASPLAQLPCPHYLVMTATPIPRTLSLTVFGDLDVSTITALPPGRTPIATRVVTPDKAGEVYAHLAKRIARGEQAYVVVPAIDAQGHESATQLKNVRTHTKMLSEKYLPDHRVATVHGQLKPQTRETIMHRFRQGKIHVLVATTVIEVGVDVPNATVMIVEHAERFGLAQLHQLRGRIGRGTDGKRSLCVLIADPSTEDAAKRLEAIAATTDGFKIAEHDLAIRGMGDFFGTRQHGLTPLRVARIPEDMDLLQMAGRDAAAIVDCDPNLTEPAHQLLRKVLIQQYGDSLGLIDVG